MKKNPARRAPAARSRRPRKSRGGPALAATAAVALPAPALSEAHRIFLAEMQEGTAVISADGAIIECNPRFAALLGRTPERMRHHALPPHLTPEAWHELRSLLEGERESIRYETVLTDDANSVVPVQLAATRLGAKRSRHLALIVRDLTSRKENEDLRGAREAAERANQAKDDFLAALSHELRTPLTPALMAATVLEKDTGLPESARSDVSLIRRNVELEARLIDDLLDLTLITRGKLPLQTSELNLHACLNRAIEVCQAEARQKRLNLQIELAARHTRIQGDPVRVQQACWNVLRNAVKFTPERGNVSILTGNDDQQHVWVRIADTGMGFTPDQAERIFDAFAQAGRHVARRFGGLGLGLAITRSIMQAHGGTVEAASAGLNHGAVVTLRFPLALAVTPRAEPPADAPGRRGLSILLVEDHRDTRLCIQRLLEAASHRITAVGSAEDALTAAERQTFDLVISDLGLPDLTGHELMRRLHDRFALPGIALSGYGMEVDQERSRVAGFKYHLTKPVSFDQLKAYVAEFATHRHAAAPTAGVSP